MLTLGECKAGGKPGGVLDLPEDEDIDGDDQDEGSGDRNTAQSPRDIPGDRGCVLSWLIVTVGEEDIWLEGEFEKEFSFVFLFFGLVGVEGWFVGSVVSMWEGELVKISDSLLPAML